MTIDFDAIQARNPLPEYCERRGIKLRRSGVRWVGKCPLHNEIKGDAFVVFDDGHWQCYGKCQKYGDVVDLEQALTGGTLIEADERLVGGYFGAAAPRASTKRSVPQAKSIRLPDNLEGPTSDDIRRLSESRSIAAPALKMAANRGLWRCFDDEVNGRCWVITDRRRLCAIRRRLENELFIVADGNQTKAAASPGSEMKAPLGYLEAEPFPFVGIVEGGPNALALIAHACAHGAEERVAPICMPSSSAGFTVESLRYLQGKRARIFVDNDMAGQKAAQGWALQLHGAGIQVDAFGFNGLLQSNGEPVKDLNDLCRIDAESWEQHRAVVESLMDFALTREVAQ